MLTFNLRDGSRLCVPADLRRIAPYVFAEQEDWFRAWERIEGSPISLDLIAFK